MKWVSFVCIIALSFFTISASAQWTDIELENGGFENWTDGQPAGWELFPGIDPQDCTSTCTIQSTTDAPSGKTALVVTGDGATCRWLGPLQQPISVSPGDIFSLSGMIKTIDVDPKGQRYRNCQIYAVIYDAQEQRCGYFGTQAIFGTNNWAKHEVAIQIPPNAVSMRIGAFLSLPGTAMFDDVKLSPLITPQVQDQWSRAERWDTDMDFMLGLLDFFHPEPYSKSKKEEFVSGLEKIKH